MHDVDLYGRSCNNFDSRFRNFTSYAGKKLPVLKNILRYLRGTGTSVRCEEKWNISATDERKWNPIFASEAFLESKGM